MARNDSLTKLALTVRKGNLQQSQQLLQQIGPRQLCPLFKLTVSGQSFTTTCMHEACKGSKPPHTQIACLIMDRYDELLADSQAPPSTTDSPQSEHSSGITLTGHSAVTNPAFKLDSEQHPALYYACTLHKLDILRRVFEHSSNSDIHFTGANQETALHWCCRAAFVPGISFLLDKNADPGLKNKDGQFPFELLLEQDESENGRMRYDDSLTLAEAIKEHELTGVLPRLIPREEKLRKELRKKEFSNGITLLHLLAACDLDTSSLAFLKDLITKEKQKSPHNASVLSKDESGHTPLQVACYQGFVGNMQVLLEAQKGSGDTADDTTALMLAVQQGHVEVTEFLLEHGSFNDLDFGVLLMSATDDSIKFFLRGAISHRKFTEACGLDTSRMLSDITSKLPAGHDLQLARDEDTTSVWSVTKQGDDHIVNECINEIHRQQLSMLTKLEELEESLLDLSEKLSASAPPHGRQSRTSSGKLLSRKGTLLTLDLGALERQRSGDSLPPVATPGKRKPPNPIHDDTDEGINSPKLGDNREYNGVSPSGNTNCLANSTITLSSNLRDLKLCQDKLRVMKEALGDDAKLEQSKNKITFLLQHHLRVVRQEKVNLRYTDYVHYLIFSLLAQEVGDKWKLLLQKLMFRFPSWFVQLVIQEVKRTHTEYPEKVMESLRIWKVLCTEEELPIYQLIEALGSQELNLPEVASTVKRKIDNMEKDDETKAKEFFSMESLSDFCHKLSGEWMAVSRALNFKQHHYAIMKENKNKKLQHTVSEMLLLWKEEVQDSAGAVQVVTQLAQACGKARRNDLKGQLLGMFDEKAELPDKLLISLASGVGAEWLRLGSELGIHCAELGKIEKEHEQGVSTSGSFHVFAMLKTWREKTAGSLQIKLGALISALYAAGKEELVEEIGLHYTSSDPSSITNAVLWGVSALVTKPGHQPWGMEEFMLLGESLGFTDKDLKFIQESAGQDGEGDEGDWSEQVFALLLMWRDQGQITHPHRQMVASLVGSIQILDRVEQLDKIQLMLQPGRPERKNNKMRQAARAIIQKERVGHGEDEEQ